MTKAQAREERTNDKIATLNDFQIVGHFSFESLKSSEASNTIIINPTIPNTSRTLNSISPVEKPMNFIPCLIRIPRPISIKTDGMLVFLEIILKK